MHNKLQLSDLSNELKRPDGDMRDIEKRLEAIDINIPSKKIRFVNEKTAQISKWISKWFGILVCGVLLVAYNVYWILSWWEPPTFWLAFFTVIACLFGNGFIVFVFMMVWALITDALGPIIRCFVNIFIMPDFSKNLEQTYKANQPEISRLQSQKNLD